LSWDTDTTRQRFALADYEALQPEARRFAGLAAAQDVSIMQDAVSTPGLLVTGNYFELLGARPALGRLLRPDDAAARGGVAVVVLSHQTWRSRYGSDPAIVGQQIQFGRQRFEVVGVAEPHARLSGQEFVSFWAPLTMASAFPGVDPWSEPDAASLVVLGRLRQDATAASVRAWLEMWLRQRFPAPSDAAPVAVRIDSLATRIPLNGVTLTLFVFIMSAFGLVLLVASANVTNLMLPARWHDSRKSPCAWRLVPAGGGGAPVDRGKPGARRSGGRGGACPHHRHGSRFSRRDPHHGSL
jgi:MacB-like periplasmic core domain